MNSGVPLLVWALTILGFLVIVGLDLLVVARRRRQVTTASAVRWLLLYVGLACLFGLALVQWGPPHTGPEFFAGYVTEYSLSVDNLFVFLVIISRMQVPSEAHDQVLFVGIVLSMALRAVFIVAGVAAVSAASWTFYLLGAFLLYTAWALAFGDDADDDFREHAVIRLLRRRLPFSSEYAGARFTVNVDGRRLVTPLVLAIAAIGVANVVFAVDSIPAIFGPTTNAYVVLAANAFALLGLRQLYFVVERLLNRLRYLKAGLVVVLAFIGVKLILEALWSTHVRHLGSWQVPQVSTTASLTTIVVVLAAVTAASLLQDAGKPPSAAD